MRRKEKQITDRKEIDAIIHASLVCRMAMARENKPYLVPLSFGYDGSAIYLHTAAEGHKIDYIEANPNVCVEFEHQVQVLEDDNQACKWSFRFQSVIGFGTIRELVDPSRKEQGLNHIMKHYSHKEWSFNLKAVAKTRVWKIDIHSLQGKRSI
ncbi:MAG: pyridoxamine 5'-phosphate oxidase family protein [Desulfobacteraceae bacterium]